MRSPAVLLALVLAAGPAAVADARPRRQAALRPHHRHRGDRLVLVARPRRPRRGPAAGDRRAVLLARSCSTPAGRLLGKGTATSGRVYAPGVVADLDARRAQGDRRRRQRRHRRGVRARSRGRLQLKAGLAGVDLQRRPVPRGARHGGRRPRRRRPHRGRGDDDEHVADRLAGVRLRRGRRPYRPPGAPAPPGPATTRRRRRRRLQRRRQPRLRRLRRERRDRQARRRPAARARRHVRQPPDQRLQPRRHVGARLAVVHATGRAATPARGSAGGSSSAG